MRKRKTIRYWFCNICRAYAKFSNDLHIKTLNDYLIDIKIWVLKSFRTNIETFLFQENILLYMQIDLINEKGRTCGTTLHKPSYLKTSKPKFT